MSSNLNTTPTKKVVKTINYLNRDFSGFRSDLIKYAETYFPNTYKDFNETSIGMMFMEMVSYIGDVLGFYIDQQAQENILSSATQIKNVYRLAQALGYHPKLVSPASGLVDFYMTVDALPTTPYEPDMSQALVLSQGIRLQGQSNYITMENVDFTKDNNIITVLESVNNIPQAYMIKTQVKVESGIDKAISVNVNSLNTKYKTIEIPDDNFIDIISVTDEQGYEWRQVPFLAQDTVFVDKENTSNNPNWGTDVNETPYLLNVKKEPKRFTTRLNDKGLVELVFGPGNAEQDNLELIPQYNLYNDNIPDFFDINNFLKTNSYGESPTGVITVNYRLGNGVQDNAAANTIDTVSSTLSDFYVKGSIGKINTIAVNNSEAITGGSNGEAIEEIKLNAMNFFSAQGRAVTPEDYTATTLSMPYKYGKISKAYVSKFLDDPSGVIRLWVLGYDSNGNFLAANSTTKRNLSIFLNTKRSINDIVEINDAFIINLGISFRIKAIPNFNKNTVLLDCLVAVKELLSNDRMQINQTLSLSDINRELSKINGVQDILEITPGVKHGGDYSPYKYNITENTINNIIYPSKDPMIFEVKFPDIDIQGEVI